MASAAGRQVPRLSVCADSKPCRHVCGGCTDDLLAGHQRVKQERPRAYFSEGRTSELPSEVSSGLTGGLMGLLSGKGTLCMTASYTTADCMATSRLRGSLKICDDYNVSM